MRSGGACHQFVRILSSNSRRTSRQTMSTVSKAWQQLTVTNAANGSLVLPFSSRKLRGHYDFSWVGGASCCSESKSRAFMWPPSLATVGFRASPNLRNAFTCDQTWLALRCLSGNTSVKHVHNGPMMSETREAALAVKQCAGLLAFYADHHVVPLPPDHRFPMTKYRTTRMLLEEDASLEGILVTCPGPQASEKELCLVHEKSYVEKIKTGDLNVQEQRTIGFPWSPELVRRSVASCGGTIAAMHAVMLGVARAAANIAGGTHHAFAGHGEGFCVYNDIAVAAMVALNEYPTSCNLQSPILVIDLDVHQGNGTAKIFEDDERVITFSMHGEKNYPWRTKMKSDYDVDLPDGTGDEDYLSTLAQWLPRIFENHRPFLVFFQAGVDALNEDSFGRLSLTSACLEQNLPLVITMGGGYSHPSDASIEAHADVYRSAALRYGSGKIFSRTKL